MEDTTTPGTRLPLQTKDIQKTHLEWIAERFPQCITETNDDRGFSERIVDIDKLQQELGQADTPPQRERYHLDWPGKHESLRLANDPTTQTLRPRRDDSLNFDNTRNLFIEGDNLTALKLLQETYLNRVKLIYIDPPYNTGKDFVYSDNFTESSEAYAIDTQQKDEEGGKLVTNPESAGRFHSNWLSMMYSRLRLSRNLLTDDGAIFISIDDGEVSNLRKLCDEVFGEDNFVTQIIWKKRSTPPQDKQIGAQHDYVLVYAKSYSSSTINLRPRSEDQIARYKNPDNHPKGPWASGDLMANVKGGRYVASLHFPIVNPNTGEEHYPSSNGNWRFNSRKIEQLIANNELYFGADGTGRPKLKRFLSDIKDGITWTSLWDFAPLNTEGSSEMKRIFGNQTVFENPKPVGLIKEIIRAGANKHSIILDFFAGSGTTAHATMQLNAEDNGHRTFINVQLGEACPDSSEAYKAGFQTIAEVSKERIRRAASEIASNQAIDAAKVDLGFRSFKIDSSNMHDVYYAPDDISQGDLWDQSENVKEDRTHEDLLFQVLLDWGIPLSLPITQESIANKTVLFVDSNALAACFDPNLDEELIKQIAARQPLRAVFRDTSYGNDAVKINVQQIFKAISPNTEVKSI